MPSDPQARSRALVRQPLQARHLDPAGRAPGREEHDEIERAVEREGPRGHAAPGVRQGEGRQHEPVRRRARRGIPLEWRYAPAKTSARGL